MTVIIYYRAGDMSKYGAVTKLEVDSPHYIDLYHESKLFQRLPAVGVMKMEVIP